jgi:hypothetical protein
MLTFQFSQGIFNFVVGRSHSENTRNFVKDTETRRSLAFLDSRFNTPQKHEAQQHQLYVDGYGKVADDRSSRPQAVATAEIAETWHSSDRSSAKSELKSRKRFGFWQNSKTRRKS